MKILNFGSLNLDHDYAVDHFVRAGETLASLHLKTVAGGKGLNQSLALQRAGQQVYHAGQIGSDGQMLRSLLEENGVSTEYLFTADEPTGHAIIQITPQGQNSILLFGGANTAITEKTIKHVLSGFEKGDVLLCQNEISHMDKLISLAHAKGMRIALNPSPYNGKITNDMLQKCTWLFVNENEGEAITGRSASAPSLLLDALCASYPNAHIILTLGERGVVSGEREQRWQQPGQKVNAVDTTAAGDTFTGYYLAAIIERRPEQEALRLATQAAALAVTRPGAEPSIPYRREVQDGLI